jgi:hypothetical protein
MLRYNGNKGVMMIGVLVPNALQDASDAAEKMIAQGLAVTGVCPVVGDILVPVPDIQLIVRRRVFQMRDGEVWLWFETEISN